MHIIIFALLSLFACVARAETTVTLLTKPLLVTVTISEPTSTKCGVVTLKFTVQARQNTEYVSSTPVFCQGSPLEAEVRKHVVWRPPYLLIQSHCGGGTSWTCESRVLFSYRNGRLTRLGDIDDLLFLTNTTHFLQTYTTLEENELTGHTGRRLRMVLRDDGTRLVLDSDLTWVLNHEQYSRYDAGALECGPQAFQGACGYELKVAAVFNATLAKLTNRPHYVQSVYNRARDRMSPSEFNTFASLMERVTPVDISTTVRNH